jgi:hypothetical protein
MVVSSLSASYLHGDCQTGKSAVPTDEDLNVPGAELMAMVGPRLLPG